VTKTFHLATGGGVSKTTANQSALVAGGTGLVGREILRYLSNDSRIAEVRALVRRPLPGEKKDKPVRELITDFGDLQKHPDWFAADAVFSALGTTIAKAGSQEAFRRVDFEYPLAIAKLARAAGARHFLFVSALGAGARSFFFYNRVKGELEEAILALGFPSVTIARPSLLLGERKEHRFGEELAKRFAWLYPAPWAPVQAAQVAAALVRAAQEDKPGVQILENRQLRKQAM
jgi:uncharacterized protein YbjT (DUF2867 family)